MRKITKKQKNPDDELYERLLKTAKLSLPKDPAAAFELGRIYGIKLSLEKFCDLNFLKKRKIKKIIDVAFEEMMSQL